jgi:parallel beta-helix repeat protein
LDSACIDKGDPCYIPDPGETDIDIDGDPQVMGAYVDIGADEVKRVHNITKDKWYWYINEAIDDATSGDEIVAYEDTYYENVDFDGKAITVRSTDPGNWDVVAATIINASDSGYTVRFDSGERTNSRLKGFTITRGGKYGVYCKNTMPYIQQCAITDNGSHGIYMYQTSRAFCRPTIQKNKIHDNGGRGICGYGNISRKLRPSIKSNWIYENGGYGIYIYKGRATVYNNTIVGNTSTGIRHRSSGSTTVKNCIVWDNGNDLSGSGCSATYSCIQDIDPGTGNIVGNPNNPSFVDRNGPDDILGTADDDYRLSSGSPCIDAANGNVDPTTDIFGQARVDDPNTPNTGIGNPIYVDMGAFEYNPN